MNNIDVINSAEFQKAVWHCVEKSIEACNSCGATYDEWYLENKWSKRLIDAVKGSPNAEKLIQYAEKEFAF